MNREEVLRDARDAVRDEATIEVVRDTVNELEQLTERLRSFLNGIEDSA